MVSEEHIRAIQSHITEFLSVISDRQTYQNLLYLFITSIIGGIYFIGVFFGSFAAIIIALTIIGIPLLILLIAGARGAAEFERRLTNELLGTDIPSPSQSVNPFSQGWIDAFRELILSNTTWKGVGFLAIKGVMAFVLPLFVLVVGFTSLAMILSPIGESVIWEVWTIDTWIESLIAFPLGIIILISMLHALNGVARITGEIAESLLK